LSDGPLMAGVAHLLGSGPLAHPSLLPPLGREGGSILWSLSGTY
jgi:hypothetical protein